MKYIKAALLMLLILSVMFSCNEKRETLAIGTHPEGWNNSTSDNFHGKLVLENASQAQNCASCHGKNYDGGTSGVSCSSTGCHNYYPHDEGFTDSQSGQFHGDALKLVGYNLESCQACHGDDFMGAGLQEKNCFTSGCHKVYPHKEGFSSEASAKFHGTFIADSLTWDFSDCASCHGDNYKGDGVAQKNCYKSGCHVNFPHKEGYAEVTSANFHGMFIADTLEFDITSCTDCHGDDYMGNGYEPKNCQACHNNLYPHPDNFVSPSSDKFHGDLISEQLSGDQTVCQPCHGTDYKGEGYTQKNCMACHSLYPHSSEFSNPQSEQFHGVYIADQLSFSLSSCQGCHGEDLGGAGQETKNCRRCHTQYPHFDGYEDENAENFHGDEIADDLNWDMSTCQSCHGSDYAGAGYEQKNCYTCHSNFPHTASFTDSTSADFHGVYIAEDLNFDISTCQSCHGTDFMGNGYAGKNCYTCHEQYPHATGFENENSANFHGTYVENTLNWDITTCQSCHGEDYSGAGYEEKNCYTCHAIFPHEDGFTDSMSEDFHGTYIAETLNWNMESCQSCHGEDYKGNGYAGKNCYTCHDQFPHEDGFANPASANFHGDYIEETLNWDLSTCQSCHGEDFSGNGYDNKNCRTCHPDYPHADEFINSESDAFHGVYLATTHEWDMTVCRDCHGEDYSGNGAQAKNCLTCHTQANGPEACNTCHGSENSFAPPPDLSGNMMTTALAVGAHQAHLAESDIAATYEMECSQCHITPQNYSDAGHIKDGTPNAEIVFNAFVSDSGRTTPLWNHDEGSCSNLYCHGDFRFEKANSSNQFAYTDSIIVGDNPTMDWTSVGSGQAACGTCHGLPPAGHVASTSCGSCHPSVVDGDNNIINNKLHINGKVDVF